jgi:hypothetical protein
MVILAYEIFQLHHVWPSLHCCGTLLAQAAIVGVGIALHFMALSKNGFFVKTLV